MYHFAYCSRRMARYANMLHLDADMDAARPKVRDSGNLGIHLAKNLPPGQIDKKRRRNAALHACFSRLVDICRQPL